MKSSNSKTIQWRIMNGELRKRFMASIDRIVIDSWAIFERQPTEGGRLFFTD